MSVTITTIQPQDSIASSRLTLNSNFSALKAGIDAVQVLLDPTTSVLSGVKSATINDNAVSSSTTIFQVAILFIFTHFFLFIHRLLSI